MGWYRPFYLGTQWVRYHSIRGSTMAVSRVLSSNHGFTCIGMFFTIYCDYKWVQLHEKWNHQMAACPTYRKPRTRVWIDYLTRTMSQTIGHTQLQWELGHPLFIHKDINHAIFIKDAKGYKVIEPMSAEVSTLCSYIGKEMKVKRLWQRRASRFWLGLVVLQEQPPYCLLWSINHGRLVGLTLGSNTRRT